MQRKANFVTVILVNSQNKIQTQIIFNLQSSQQSDLATGKASGVVKI